MDSMEKCSYFDLRLETTNNGHKVTFYEKKPMEGRGMYDHMESSRKEFVFGDKDFKAAVEKYKEVSDHIMYYNKKKESPSEVEDDD